MRCLQRPTPEEMKLALAVPPPDDFLGLGAWVEHLAAPREEKVSVLVQEYLSMPPEIVHKLIEFGAIYTCPIIPEIPAAMVEKIAPEQVEEMTRKRKIAWDLATREMRQSNPQRLTQDTVVPEHYYVRIHMSPKRFPIFYQVDWSQRLVAHGPDYIVLDKPAYLPTAPTVDNILESSLAGAAKSIGATEPLLITSRLDQATEGLLVLGKTAEFVQKFNLIVRGSTGKQYKKLYRALVSTPPPLGKMTHHVRVRCRRQGTPFFTLILREESAAQPKAQYCELNVLEVQAVELGKAARHRFNGMNEAYEVLIELVTGRTHQIRAQLSAVGCPLLGDDLYGPLSDTRLRNRFEDDDQTLEMIDSQGVRLLAEADGPIGLQACQLEFSNGSLFGQREEESSVFKAGEPWWR